MRAFGGVIIIIAGRHHLVDAFGVLCAELAVVAVFVLAATDPRGRPKGADISRSGRID